MNNEINLEAMFADDGIESLVMEAEAAAEGEEATRQSNVDEIMNFGKEPEELIQVEVGSVEAELQQTLPEEEMSKLDELANERLAKMKDNLNKAYDKRDLATSELQQLRKEIQDLKNPENSVREASKEVIAENEALREQLATLQGEQTSMRVSDSVNGALANQNFVSEKAKEMVSEALKSSMMVGEDNEIFDKTTGRTPSEALTVLRTSNEYRFLFKQEASSGPSVQAATAGASVGNPTKNITEMTFAEFAASNQVKQGFDF